MKKITTNIRHTGLLALIACSLVFLPGCVTNPSVARSGASCSTCRCAACSASRMGTMSADLQSQPIVDPANGSYMADSPATQDLAPLQLPYPKQLLPATPESNLPPAVATVNEGSIRDSEACQQRARLQDQTDLLKSQMQRLESHLQQERTNQESLQRSLTSVTRKVGTLSSELHYWKQEVQRIDAEAEQQHQDDLNSLSTISELISKLPRPATAAAEQSPQ